VPSRIVRDELAQEIAQKLGIDSAVLRQELKHAVTNRSSATLKAPAEAQITDSEKILIRALVSATEVQTVQEHISARDGAEEEFDPARQARFVLQTDQVHAGLATESLIETLLTTELKTADVMELPLPDSERNLLASILLKEEEELTVERLEGAVRALRKIQLKRKMEQVQHELQHKKHEPERLRVLLREKDRLKRELMDPSLRENAIADSA
jgi:DNA primase